MCFESKKMYTFGNMGKVPSKAQTKTQKTILSGRFSEPYKRVGD